MHRSFECSTTASAVVKKQFTGQTAWQGASVQCMHAMVTERSPGLPSLMVTTRRRLMPHGTSCSFLQAVTQALHSMQRSASQRNFIRAMARASTSRMTFFELSSCSFSLLEHVLFHKIGVHFCGTCLRRPDLAESRFGLLHAGRGVVAVRGDRIRA